MDNPTPKKKRTIFPILIWLGLIALIVFGIYLFTFLRTPLGQPLVLSPIATSTNIPEKEKSNPTVIPTASEMSESIDSPNQPVCGQSGAYNILVIGSDSDDMKELQGSDLTRLARFDFSNKAVAVFALPRDLWVDARSLEFQDPLLEETTLGKVYFEAYIRSKQQTQTGKMSDGAQFSAQMIADNFDVINDHYIVMDLHQLDNFINVIGGLPIDVPERTTDPWIGMVIEAGPQIMTGAQLKAYVRAIPDSDFARIQRNNLILLALRQKLLDPAVWIKLPKLYEQFKSSIATDLSPQDILNLICLFKEVPKENIVLEQVKPEWTSEGPDKSLLWEKEKVLPILSQLELLP